MNRYRDRSEHKTGWNFNMTPLIDVTFLLLTYFMLASHFASAERPDMQIPQPEQSLAQATPQDDKVIINLLYTDAESEPAMTFGPLAVDSLEELSDRLARLAQHNPRIEITLRADRRVRYGEVRRIMEAVAAANLGNLKVVAETDNTR